MEPKKNSKRNPKVSRAGSSRPRVQSQPAYRPQMNEIPFHSQPVYQQPPPVYQQPVSPFSYTTQQPHFPDNFSPFETMRTPVNIPEDDTEEDEPFVPETQFANEEDEEDEEVQEVQEPEEVPTRPPKKVDKKNWTAEEEEALAKSWVKISVDKVVGDRQKRMGFWTRITNHFNTLVPGSPRTKDQTNSKWNKMNPLISSFNGYYHQAVYIYIYYYYTYIYYTYIFFINTYYLFCT